MKECTLRDLPKVDEVMKAARLGKSCSVEPQVLKNAVRHALEELRCGVISGEITALPSLDFLVQRVHAIANQENFYSLRRVINATGVILHTNLGRACLSKRAVQAVTEVAGNYSNLEYNVESGGRGFRYSHVEAILKKLTGAESAMVVNNNAAAVLLILSALASGGEVITSRGELVEIGGAFRVPDIMESCGCLLKEVGTTNKTHLRDYEKAIGENTRALLKVHTSNFKIVGFTESVSISEMVALGGREGIPVIQDLGSGSLCDLNQFGLREEPTVQEAVAAGVDILSFSGDKLLGGPQAGIILGRKKYMDILRQHPLSRAMRVDKLTLAALEATLQSYDRGSAIQEIPTLRMLGETEERLRKKAAALCSMMEKSGIEAEIIREVSQVGGGSVPSQALPTYAVGILESKRSPNELERALRLWKKQPIIVRIVRGRCIMDVRTLMEEDFACIVQALTEILT